MGKRANWMAIAALGLAWAGLSALPADAQICAADPRAAALAACQAVFPNCVDTATLGGGPAFGIIGHVNSNAPGSNCDPPSDWQMFCYGTGFDAYNCAECVAGDIQRSHTPCNCGPGTTPTIGTFCIGQPGTPVPAASPASLLALTLLLPGVALLRPMRRSPG